MHGGPQACTAASASADAPALSNHLLAANKKLTTFIGDGKPRTTTQTEGMLKELHDTLSGVEEQATIPHQQSIRDE